MSKTQSITVTERDNTLNPRQLRVAGFVPVTLYGKETPSVQLQTRTHELTNALSKGIGTFELSGYTTATAKVQQLQVDPVLQHPISLELLLVDGTVPKAETPLKVSKKVAQSSKTKKPEAVTV